MIQINILNYLGSIKRKKLFENKNNGDYFFLIMY